MKILTFDTALNKTYISLSENEDILEKITIENHEDKYHSAFLIKEIAKVLKKNHLQMKDINALGVNIGPGSFTGIRACTTVGRVIAQQLNLPLIPVSSLEILSKINENNSKTLVTLDARKKSAYIGVYENGNEVISPKILPVDELISIAKEFPYIISDSAIYEILKNNNIYTINYETQNYPLNKYLAEITFYKIIKTNNPNGDYNWAKVKPLYIQPPSVFGGIKK